MNASEKPEISVVVPVYNESGNVVPLLREIEQAVRSLGRPYEILFVNDGSQDNTLSELQAELRRCPSLRIIDLAENVGEAGALTAGFQNARGRWIITLDGDGQNDPADIPRLWEEMQKGYAVVSGWRRQRQEGFFLRVLPSRIANALIRWITRVPLHDNGCGLKIYRAEVARRVQLPRGFNRFLPAILGVHAHEVAEIEVRDRRRQHGSSHYGLSRTLIVLRDLLAMPFLLRDPQRFERLWRAILQAAALAVVCALVLGWFGAAFLGVLLSAVAAMIWWNLHRFVRAQQVGVFRVERELSYLVPEAQRRTSRATAGSGLA